VKSGLIISALMERTLMKSVLLESALFIVQNYDSTPFTIQPCCSVGWGYGCLGVVTPVIVILTAVFAVFTI